MSKKLTILDVARLAGVSKATVSRVLNGNARVDPELRERVLQIIKEHDYVPSINALGLNGHSQLLGILMPRYLWPALQEITWSFATYISTQTRYEIIFYSSSNEEGYSKVIDQILQSNLVAGLIATLYDQSPAYLVELYKKGLPVVLVDTIGVQSELPTIGADHYHGAYEAVRYLLEMGHRRIAYINGSERWNCSKDRYRGYRDALEDFGLHADPALFRQGDYTFTSSTEVSHDLLTLEDRPTAVFAGNDDMAYGTIIAAQEHHLRVPEDLSVIGFNDDPTPLVRSTLTTIHQPFAEMARCAAELLVAMIQPEHTFSSDWQQLLAKATQPMRANKLEDINMPLQIEMPTHLVVRNTCSPI